MNQNRVDSIKKKLEGVGPDSTTLYTNQEMVNKCQAMQKAMIAGVYETIHAQYMRERDLMMHFAILAAEYGLEKSEVYKRFEKNMKALGYTIVSFIKGLKGERIAKSALTQIAYDKNVKILYNVALEDENSQAEYDAIVITPYGVFVVEVKNWSGEILIDKNGMLRRADRDFKYDLPGRMSVKEGLLHKYLGELFHGRYQGMVMFADENANVIDEYEQIPICYGCGIGYKIRAFDDGQEVLTKEQIERIADTITSNHKEQKTLCKVNCEEIIEDYALLMAAIEEAAEGEYSSIEELKNMNQEVDKEVKDVMDQNVKIPKLTEDVVDRDRMIKNMVGGVAGLLVAFGLGIATKSVVSRK